MHSPLPRKRALWAGVSALALAAVGFGPALASTSSGGTKLLGPALAAVTSPLAPAATSTTETVPASIASDCSTPVDSKLNAFLASVPNNTTVVFAPNGCYAQDGSFEVTNKTGLVLNGNGATFKAVTQGGPQRASWIVLNGSAITLEDMTIDGANPHPGIPNESPAALQWQHGISFESTQGATVDNVDIFNTYGDFLDARDNGSSSFVPSRNIVVENSHFANSGRMGLALTNVDGFTFTNSYLGNVPEAGIDLETNSVESYGRNMVFSNDSFGNTRFELFNVYALATSGRVGNITFTGDTMTGPLTLRMESCQPAFIVNPETNQMLSGFTITDNKLLGYGDMVNFDHVSGATIKGNTYNFQNGECSNVVGISLANTAAITMGNNVFSGLTHPALAQS
jgi:hypothetical protein